MQGSSHICLDRAQFHSAIHAFSQQDTSWTLHTQKTTGHQYLTRTTQREASRWSVLDENQEPMGSNEDLTEDWAVEGLEDMDPAVAPSRHAKFLTIEHHIVYSSSYQVPVLYFNTQDQDGSPLSLDAIYSQWVAPELRGSLTSDAMSSQGALTQGEHPELGLPYWYIHPCQTQAFLSALQCPVTIETYCKTWLSFVGPAAGCTLPAHLFSP